MIRDAVIHMSNEQPLLADLYGIPSPADVALLCTRLRTLNGKRPVFADNVDSVFLFPLAHIRFVEIPPGSTEEAGGEAPALTAGDRQEPEREVELEIDEELLRRIREA